MNKFFIGFVFLFVSSLHLAFALNMQSQHKPIALKAKDKIIADFVLAPKAVIESKAENMAGNAISPSKETKQIVEKQQESKRIVKDVKKVKEIKRKKQIKQAAIIPTNPQVVKEIREETALNHSRNNDDIVSNGVSGNNSDNSGSQSKGKRAFGDSKGSSNRQGLKGNWSGALLSHFNRIKRYPPQAKRFKRGNSVEIAKISITVDAKGRVINYKLLQSSGNQILDKNAIALVANSQVPAPPSEILENGLATTNINLHYTLQ